MDDVLQRADRYAKERSLTFTKDLGAGVHGIVRVAKHNANFRRFAVKVHRYEDPYRREKAAYLRLEELGLNAVRGFNVPQLLRYDDDFRVIEMTVVVRPFVLDFADAWLDEAPEFSDEVWADWNRKIDDDFEDRAAEVRRVLAALRSHGVILLDLHPGNIRFGD